MAIQWEILAGLRFFLAWIVVVSHVSHFVPYRDFLIRFDYFGGHAAVLGFLIVSGFSIAHSISKKKKGFYRRRFRRIYPLYFAAILTSLVPFLVTGQDIKEYKLPVITNFLGNLFSLQGFFVHPLTSNSALWTLSVEFACYLLAPLFLRLKKKYMIALILISSVCYALYPHSASPLGNGTTTSLYGIPFLLLLWAWLLGFFFFFHSHEKSARILLISLGCLMIITSYSYYGVGRLAIFTYIISALALIYSPKITIPQYLLSVFQYLGELSYPLYLFHFSAIFFGYAVLRINNSFILVGLALILSIFFYHLIDVPMRYKGKKL